MREFIIWAVLYYLRFWAKIALKINNPYVIGIAGSVGKSSTRNALYGVLKDHFSTKIVSGNSETGVPLGILGIEVTGFNKRDWLKTLVRAPFGISNLKKVQYLVVEMGIDDPYPPKNMSYLLTIVVPDMAIDLNATATHTMQFEKLLKRNIHDPVSFLVRKIAEEDSKIITNGHTEVGIYNADDKNLTDIFSKFSKNSNTRIFSFGHDTTNTIYYTNYTVTTAKTKYSYILNTEKGPSTVDLTFPGILLSPASRESFASVILAAHQLGLKIVQIKEALEKNFTLPKGRSSLFPGIKESLLIDSSYNSSKSSVISFLNVLEVLKEKTKRPIVFLMGDMRELGNESQKEHEEVARALLPIVDQLYCVGPLTREFVVPVVKNNTEKGKTKKVEWYKNAIQAGLHLKEELPQNAIVLIKGSQNTIYLEEAIKFLLENGADTKKLTRQEDYWMKTKQEYFNIE